MEPLSFGYKYSCDTPLKVSFSDSSIGATHFKWIFGDGTVDNVNRNPVHIYPSIGSYTARLVVYNDTTFCRDTLDVNLNLVSPIVDFTADDTTICDGDTIMFTAAITGSAVLKHLWFVNGSLISPNGASIL